jgi:hypothetical protein
MHYIIYYARCNIYVKNISILSLFDFPTVHYIFHFVYFDPAGLIRYLIVCLDCSVHAKDTDYRPNRLEASKAAIERFIREYFDQKPISQVGECVRNGNVCVLTHSQSHSHLLTFI